MKNHEGGMGQGLEAAAARRTMVTLDGNEAAVSVAYRLSEVAAIYPITPSSTMGELADEWSAKGRANIWGTIPRISQMQSEGGAAGAVHGALQAGALTTTFTASQGLLLMIPSMYKIAGELLPFVMHVSARTLATHALSIFGDHQDVMSCRQTGFAMLCANSVQESHDMALIAHAATLRSRVPFLHFFDGFRTSHEVNKIRELSDDDLRALMDDEAVAAFRRRAMTPDRPVLRGAAQNPDTFFQAREACNPYYEDCPRQVKEVMGQFAARTGRRYGLFDYVGDAQAERVIVMMGSGAQTAEQTARWMCDHGQGVGVLKVRLYRPWSNEDFVRALPPGVRRIAVLDRTKEPGSLGEPLYQDVVCALCEARETGLIEQEPSVIGGRYGLSSKEFTPAMVKAVFDEMDLPRPRRRFTVGIMDDVTHLSLDVEEGFEILGDEVVQCIFYGLGADGTVGANKNSIKIIGEETDNWAQGYFVYDSKKSGAITISHLRFGPEPIEAPYLIGKARFVACHQFHFLERYDVLEHAAEGAVFLLNSSMPADRVWDHLPAGVQKVIIGKNLQFHVIDAYQVARESGMGGRINTIMQTCFFGISGVLPREQAIEQIKKTIQKTYGKKGKEVVDRNFAAVDNALAHLKRVDCPKQATAAEAPALISPRAPDFVQRITAVMLSNHGDLLPVSAFAVDGTWPLSTARWEKRNLATEIPVWDAELCIQCNKCAIVCPHAAIRAKVYDPSALAGAPETFKSIDYKAPDLKGDKYTIQVAPEDCTGCRLCVMVCPARDKSNPRHKAIDMEPQAPLRGQERDNFDFFLTLPDPDRSRLRLDVKGTQMLTPLFEFSGACSGCGETPYIKLLTQLYGDRILIANATGCSSIYGGNLPTTPYCANSDGRGPSWANSLFEDNAEFGLGMRLALDKHQEQARELLLRMAGAIDRPQLVTELLNEPQSTDAQIAAQRGRVEALAERLTQIHTPESLRLALLADYLVHKSVWVVGGDGWAYDIGFGGLDHVLASGRKVNVLVLDTEVYSNTGGQQSKSTPIGAAAKFASAGKSQPKKDLGLIAMSYGSIYVAQVALGAKDVQTVKAFQEAESYPGASLIIAYSHCIAHGYDMAFGADQQKLAVESGYWPLYRYDPRRADAGEPALQLDSPAPKTPLDNYMRNETRFRMVEQQDPDRFRELSAAAQRQVQRRYRLYEHLSRMGQVEKPASGG
ncbi:MAG: pyruvate:ferredoxin (flavodoxin) oxidoreductase [Phycisphaerales bacterium]|nr:pyruvate:ferredoxin (flavodoxin) oxidoreductase [Phycisphaerales bacterium]